MPVVPEHELEVAGRALLGASLTPLSLESRKPPHTDVHAVTSAGPIDVEVTRAEPELVAARAAAVDRFHDRLTKQAASVGGSRGRELAKRFSGAYVAVSFQQLPPSRHLERHVDRLLGWLIAQERDEGTWEFHPDLTDNDRLDPAVRSLVPPVPGLERLWITRSGTHDGLRGSVLRDLRIWSPDDAILAAITKKRSKKYDLDAPAHLAVWVETALPNPFSIAQLRSRLQTKRDGPFECVWVVGDAGTVAVHEEP